MYKGKRKQNLRNRMKQLKGEFNKEKGVSEKVKGILDKLRESVMYIGNWIGAMKKRKRGK